MRSTLVLIFVMIAVVTAVFSAVCGHEFVRYDDDDLVHENPHLEHPLHFWKKPYAGLYMPLTYSFWSLQAKLAGHLYPGDPGAGPDPRVFHTANLAVHVLSTLAVFLILKVMVKDNRAACAGALLFALHPVQVEPVAWVTEMKGVLGGFLSLVAVWQYVCYVQAGDAPSGLPGPGRRSPGPDAKHRYLHYGVATAAFVLAMTAKPITAAVPVVAAAAGLGVRRRPLKQVLKEMVPWIAAAAAMVVVTRMAQPQARMDFIPALWQRLFVAGDALAFYLHRLAVPLSLGPDYGRTPSAILGHGWVYLTGVAPYLLAAAFVWKGRRSPYLAPAAVFAAALLPVLGLVPFHFQDISTVADRYLYLAMLGPALALALLLSRRGTTAAWACSILVLGALGVQSARQAKTWKDSRALFEHALKVNPGSSLAHNNLGGLLLEEGNTRDAANHFAAAIRSNPDDVAAYNNLGKALLKHGKVEAAAACYEDALALKPGSVEAHKGMGLALKMQGKLDRAAWHYEEAIRLDRGSAQAHNNLGNILQEQGKLPEAVTHYVKALELNPDFIEAHNNLGLAYQKQGKLNEAIVHFEEALRLSPGLKPVRNNLDRALRQRQQPR